jgi:hypothetical protein
VALGFFFCFLAPFSSTFLVVRCALNVETAEVRGNKIIIMSLPIKKTEKYPSLFMSIQREDETTDTLQQPPTTQLVVATSYMHTIAPQ